MYHMKRATVRDLRYDFPKVIGTLMPANSPAQVEFPDFMGRLKKIYGNKVLKVSGAELVRRDRDRSTGSLR